MSCHMPTTNYMVVDPRHDHSLRIPRPDRTDLLDTPNACNQCHTDKAAAWAGDAIRSWYPSPKPGYQSFAEAFDLADRAAPGAQAALLHIASDTSLPPIASASALLRLQQYPSPQALETATKSLKIDDPGVRAAAIAVISGADPQTRRSLLVPLLRDDTRMVRMDAARALAGEAERQLSADDRIAFDAALSEYVEAQLFNAERPEIGSANLGALWRDRGKMDEARSAFRKAMGIDPTFVAAAISLADLMRAEGQESAAEATLRQALAENPGSAPVTYALALSLIRQQRTAEAMVGLADAARAAPDEPRFSYVYAVALHDTGHQAEAINVLKSALVRHPYDRDILWAMASYQAEARDYASALAQVELLQKLEPGRSDISQLLELTEATGAIALVSNAVQFREASGEVRSFLPATVLIPISLYICLFINRAKSAGNDPRRPVTVASAAADRVHVGRPAWKNRGREGPL